MPNLNELIEVFEEARRLIDKPDNDFIYSSWEDAEMALAEIDGILASLRSGQVPTVIAILFAPTGPMQEVSLSSGWGHEFLDLANRYDRAMGIEDPCTCEQILSSQLRTVKELGMDSHFAEIAIQECPTCGRHWLRYFYEVEAISKSGRWYLGPVDPETITTQNAKETLEKMDWYFCGGSYFNGQVSRSRGPIRL